MVDAHNEDEPARPANWGPSDNLNALLPVVAFVGLNSYKGLGWAIAGTTVASLFAMWRRWKTGQGIGKFIPILAASLIIRGAIGIITDSKDVYFGTGIALKVMVAMALVGSVMVGKNALARLAPYGLPLTRSTTEHPIYISTTARLTLGWAGFLLITSLFDMWLLSQSSANGFVIIRFLVSWPISTASLGVAMFWASRQLAQIPGFPGMLALLEQQAAATKEH